MSPSPDRPGRTPVVGAGIAAGALVAAAVVALLVMTIVALGLLPGGPGAPDGPAAAGAAPGSRSPSQGGSTARGGSLPPAPDVDPAEAFLADYVNPDGRVVRRDQGGDTVSEGQAYGLLLATAAGEELTVRQIWSWTQDNLLGDSGMMAWRWADGEVVDPNPATDADLDAAWALVVAGEQFDDPALVADGTALAEAVLTESTRTTDDGLALLAGPWVGGSPWLVNPSYSSPSAAALLRDRTGDARWEQVLAGDRALLARLLEQAPLPPDWAQVDPAGAVAIMPPPGGGEVTFGLDAARVPVRLAGSCDPADQAMAASLSDTLGARSPAPGLRDLGGTATVEWSHPLAEVSAAAAAAAAGDPRAAAGRLDLAARLQAAEPTYYGAAWLALGELLLAETGTPFRPCAPLIEEEDR